MASAQDIFLAQGGADQTWKGTQPNAAAGLWMDIGAVSNDSRRDLIIGSPGGPGIAGAVYVIFGGPIRAGEFVLSNAETVITSTEAGNRFGAATAAGNVRNTDGSTPRNLVVGAPGSNGNRGAVYLFNGGFTTPTSLTVASAAYRVLGAPGDLLGSALATIDLDNDGFREIVIGAPGNNRVYIIKGGPGLTGTLDLATNPSGASVTINAPGIGAIMTAGDLNNDDINDLILGAPTQNIVYLFPGATGTIPSLATAAFTGIDAGDQAGASVRTLDLNGDGRTDIAIGAPGADGPGNARADAGEAYVFLGPVGTGAIGLATAPITFFGAAAGMRSGATIAAGDVNRDTPNDIVIHGTGGAAGAGQLDIYYGRSRNTTGILQPDGRRFVDLATAGQVSRRIIGDTGIGAISSAQVFEVTGEGARDIIVGVATAESGAGKLFFTISPKLRISPATLSFFVNENTSAAAPAPIGVINASTIGIGWETSTNQPWLTTSPVNGSADHTHPASFSVIGSAQGLAPGVYTGRVSVSSTSADLEMTLPVDVTMTVTGTRIAMDTPAANASVASPFNVAGWSVDVASTTGTGVDVVNVYAFPNSGAAPIFLGTASYGGSRADIAGLFGARFNNSGYSLAVNSLAIGGYQIVAFAHSTVSNAFSISVSRPVTVTTAGTEAPPTPPTGPPPATGPGPNTRVSVNRTALYYGAIQNGAVMTGPQQLSVNFSNGSGTWTATTSATWLEIVGGTGSGAGTFTARVKPGSYSTGLVLTGNLTITAPGVPNSPLTVPITFRSIGASGAPSGTIDTPVNNVTGVVGALPFTGWAVDDVEVKKVSVWRDGVGAEGTGLVFVGNTTFVDGARPDVEGANATPMNYRGGWGLLILTNMLPNQGNGRFRLYAIAEDAEGHTTLLGLRDITCDNAHAVRPFGTIDTPEQGGTAAGAGYVNFGWVLAPAPHNIPVNGSTITVFIDGVPVGHPTYNQNRSDIATLFPGLANSNGAIGFYIFDTNTLANGVHTIAWGVSDEAGNGEGLGSRYFTVFNGTTSSALTVSSDSSVQAMETGQPDVRQAATIGSDAGAAAATLNVLPVADTPAYARSGFDASAPLNIVEADPLGVRSVTGIEMNRFDLTLGSPVTGSGDRYEGYLVSNGRLGALPIGAFLDERNGQFFWQPGVGFAGTYQFMFVKVEGGTRQRIPVDVTITAHDRTVQERKDKR